MSAEAAAKDDRAAVVTPAIQPTAPWRVRRGAASSAVAGAGML